MSDRPVDIEALLEHRAFVWALARSLVADDARADDVAQETWLAALRNPPRHGALRAWLASVVRKLAWTHTRAENRRRARHKKGATPSPPPAPADAMERANWHQRLVNAVMELPEPYRSTLVLRYFEEMDGTEIAAIQKVPAATVRTRLRRGLERLRERFDGEDRGGRGGWVAALSALVFPPVAQPPPVAPAAASWTRTAALLTIVAGGVLWMSHLAGAPDAGDGRSPPRTAGHAGGVEPAETPAPASAPSRRRAPAGRLLDVTVLAGGGAAPGALVLLFSAEPHPWRWTPRRPWVLHERAWTGADGRVRFEGVPAGHVRAVAATPGFARGAGVAHLPQAFEQPLVLELAPEARTPLRVVGAGGAPVSGAEVTLREEATGRARLPEARPAVTDADGVAAVRGVAAGETFLFHVVAPGHAPVTMRRGEGGAPLEVELAPLDRTLSWPVTGASPPAGTRLELRRLNEPASPGAPAVVHVEEGRLVGVGFPHGTLAERIAVAPDGTFARLRADAGAVEGEPVSFRQPRQLALALRDDRGAPVAGVAVRLFDRATGTPLYPDGVTGADGRVAFSVYARDPVDVRLRGSLLEPFRSVRTYEPAAGDARMEIRLAAEEELVLRLLVDGRPALPPLFRLYFGRVRIAPEEIETDGDAATLRFAVRPRAGDSPPVHLLARGYRPVAIGERGRVDVELVPAAELVVPVFLAEERQSFALELEDAADAGRRLRRGPWRFRLYPGPDRVVREAMVPPGRYRVRDQVSGKATAEFAVPPGPGEIRVELDLSDVGAPPPPVVHGRVHAYADLDLRRARVVASADSGPVITAEVARDGTFTFVWPERGALRIHALHPDVPAVDAVAVTLNDPRARVELPLTPLHEASLQLVPAPRPPRPGETDPRVHLRGEEGGVALPALLAEGRLSFAGFRPGRYRLWIDVPGHAPTEVRNVELVEGRTDLGRVALDPGSSLRLHVLAREENVAWDLTVSAQALSEPRYQRSLRTGGANRATLAGLGAGRFRVTAWESSGRQVFSGFVQLDGTNTTELELDLR